MAKFLATDSQLTNERVWSIVTGLALILMATAGGFAYGYAHPLLHILNDLDATTAALVARPLLLLSVVLVWCLVAMLDLLVSYGIYAIYRRSAPALSFLVAAIRVLYTLVLLIAIAELGALLIGDDAGSGLEQFAAFETIWSGGLVLFGVHLMMLSHLVSHAGHPGKFFAILLALGGLGYVTIKGAEFLGNDVAIPSAIEAALSIPMILGELLYAVRLLLSRRTLASAFSSTIDN